MRQTPYHIDSKLDALFPLQMCQMFLSFKGQSATFAQMRVMLLEVVGQLGFLIGDPRRLVTGSKNGR